jgi:hypothetical protein
VDLLEQGARVSLVQAFITFCHVYGKRELPVRQDAAHPLENTRKRGGRRKHHGGSDFATKFPEKSVKPLSGLRQSAKE